MNQKQIFFLVNPKVRENALLAVRNAQEGHEVVIQPKTRSTAQNKRMWAMLSDISEQVNWYGKTMDSMQWKNFFSAILFHQEAVPNLNNTGFVVLGRATSKMTVEQMSDMQELMSAFGSERNIKWSDYPE
jgi:hypothetical protein